jgi:hypothetical protein
MSESEKDIHQEYFDKRMSEMGVRPEDNVCNVLTFDKEANANVLKPQPVFSVGREKGREGIDIFVYTLDRCKIAHGREGSRHKTLAYHITRLTNPVVKANGDVKKYHLPPGAGTFPFFPPSVIDAFEQPGDVDTLVLTEGFFKAFTAARHGMMVVGLSSIQHFREKDSQKMYPDVIKFILRKNVKRVIWLQDGDCTNITSKEITDKVDLYRRPNGFFQSAHTFKRLLDDYEHVQKYFAHVLSDDLAGNPKGLDDLLIAFPGKEQEIWEDLLKVSGGNKYFYKEDITWNIRKVHTHFHLGDVLQFYLYHVEKRPDLKDKEFVFNGTHYKYNEEKNVVDVMQPADAKHYFRVGDQYFKYVQIPNKYGVKEQTFRKRQKSTIIEDHGKSICTHIRKYEEFCNVPDHLNYQAVIHGNFNMYAPFEHEPQEGECETIISLIKHIFGSGTIKFTHPKTGEKIEIPEYELGLDYLQLLYQKPTQTLPILCLVSRENNTGKTTLAKLLKMIFTQNVAIVGNAELSDNFNASWASKLLVICDEAKIDKQIVVEKLKSLSTAEKIMMNAKGKDHVELDFFAKFILITNNEENFIYASDEDVRYWIRKVPVIKEVNVDLLIDMKDEIGPFLHFLNTRSMKTENLFRAWFHPSLIKTDALKKVIAYSMPTIEKEIRAKLRDMFLDLNVKEIMLTKKIIHKEFFNMKYEDNYLEKVLKEHIRAEMYHEIIPGDEGKEPQKVYKPIRYDYPKIEQRMNVGTGETEFIRVMIKDHGRPFVFKREMFVNETEQLSMDLQGEDNLAPAAAVTNAGNITSSEDDLPF